jgi:uncharacterized protein with HEPN domain
MAGMRDIIVHGYGEVDHPMILLAGQVHAPQALETIQTILKALREGQK